MRGRLAVFLILAVAIIFALLFGRQAYLSKDLPRAQFEQKKLRILTYSTFMGATGPGSDLIEKFKSETGQTVEVVTAGDAGLLLERLKMAEASVPFDVVIGLDQLLLEEAQKQFAWKEQFFGTSGRHPILAEYDNKFFVPYDWSPLSFVYKKSDAPVPQTIDDLLDPKYAKQFALQDPRSSTPGLQFFKWVQAIKGPGTQRFLKKFKPNVNSISPSWAFAYGLFKKEQTRFVFSYLTSLAFHWGFENNRDYRVLVFPEGHPVQVEFMAIPKTCRECELGEKFVTNMLQPWAQKIIMEKNFMLPVINGLEEGTIFAELPPLKTLRTHTGKDLSEWDKIFAH
jgi:thiamine transport system substrate-binding protein